MPVKTRILIVDDHPVFREGLVRTLQQDKNLQIVGEASGVSDALKAAAAMHPTLVIVDLSLEEGSGIDLVRMLREQSPTVRILMLSMHKESLHAERALRAGANGYIMKRESGKLLMEAIAKVLGGQSYVSEAMQEHLLQKLSGTVAAGSPLPQDLLSDRELEIFGLIGQGYGTRQIADELHVSIKTVQSHREHIRDKMHLTNTFELVQRAIHWVHNEHHAA
jgi:DNA-binding NarL/FixJ family response regulator